jgi:hypothetical protein
MYAIEEQVQVAAIGRFMFIVDPAVVVHLSIGELADFPGSYPLGFRGYWRNHNDSPIAVHPDHLI